MALGSGQRAIVRRHAAQIHSVRAETKYKQVKEIMDDPRSVNDLIDGGGWDLLTVARRAERVSGDRFTEIVVYVVGERYD